MGRVSCGQDDWNSLVESKGSTGVNLVGHGTNHWVGLSSGMDHDTSSPIFVAVLSVIASSTSHIVEVIISVLSLFSHPS